MVERAKKRGSTSLETAYDHCPLVFIIIVVISTHEIVRDDVARYPPRVQGRLCIRVYIRIYRRIMAFPREIDTFSDGWIGWKWKRRTNGVYNQDSISMNARFEVALSLIERHIYLYIYIFFIPVSIVALHQ